MNNVKCWPIDLTSHTYVYNSQTHKWICITHTQHHQHTQAFGRKMSDEVRSEMRKRFTHFALSPTRTSITIYFWRGIPSDLLLQTFLKFSYIIIYSFVFNSNGLWSTWTSLRNQNQKHTVPELKAFSVSSVKMLTCNERKLTQAMLIYVGWTYRLFA